MKNDYAKVKENFSFFLDICPSWTPSLVIPDEAGKRITCREAVQDYTFPFKFTP